VSAPCRRWKRRWMMCSDTQCAKLAITRKLTPPWEVWAMQSRFEQRSGQRAYRLFEAARFRMAYDFLALRAASGEVPPS